LPENLVSRHSSKILSHRNNRREVVKKQLKHPNLLFFENNRPAGAREQSQADPKGETHSGKQVEFCTNASVSEKTLSRVLALKAPL